MRAVILEHVPVRLDTHSSVEHGRLHLRQVLGETLILVSNLKRQLTSVTQHQHTDLVLARGESIWVQLMKSRQNKHGSLSHTRLGLTDNVHSQNGLGDALVLDLGRMLEAAVDDSTEAFGFEDEIFETGGVDSYIVTPEDAVQRWMVCEGE
jgi:hypothetical protein